ncbi:MAG: hypothetical protein ACLQME_17705 [Alphaproteobacteria bacterium]
MAQIVSIWDHLGLETQVELLHQLSKARIPEPLKSRVWAKASKGENEYVRYLVRERSKFVPEEIVAEQKGSAAKFEALVSQGQRIEDAGQAVGIKIGRTSDNSIEDAKLFYAQPQEDRLALLRSTIFIEHETRRVADLFRHAAVQLLPQGGISEVEVLELVAEYVGKPEFAERYARVDRFELEQTHDLSELWSLVPTLPADAASFLIEFLPGGRGLDRQIPDEVIGGMSSAQLNHLFSRHDVGLPEQRKRIFNRSADPGAFGGNRHIDAAASHDFDLSYEEFGALVHAARALPKVKPGDGQRDTERDSINWRLWALSFFGQDVNLVCREAAWDVLSLQDHDYGPHNPTKLEEHVRERRARGKSIADQDVVELQIYRLAKSVVPWAREGKIEPLEGELKFLNPAVRKGDTWETFVSFLDVWGKGAPVSSDIRFYPMSDKILPEIHGVTEPPLEKQRVIIELDALLARRDSLAKEIGNILDPVRPGDPEKSPETSKGIAHAAVLAASAAKFALEELEALRTVPSTLKKIKGLQEIEWVA